MNDNFLLSYHKISSNYIDCQLRRRKQPQTCTWPKRHSLRNHSSNPGYCHDIWRTYSFFDFPHDSQEESLLFTFAHDLAIHMGVILYFSRDSSSHDSCWLLLTYSDSLVFHPLFIAFPIVLWLIQGPYCSCYLLFLWRSLSFGNVYCPLWRPLFLWRHCSHLL